MNTSDNPLPEPISISPQMEMTVQPCIKTRPKDDKRSNVNPLDSDKTKPFITIKKKRRSTADEFYVNSQEFALALKEYYETENDSCRNYEKLGEYFIKIANGVSSSASFARYSWKQDMIGNALTRMTIALRGKKYSFEYGSSPFSYYTQIVYWSFINTIKNEKKQHDTIKKYRETKYGEMMDDDSGQNVYIQPENDGEIF